MRTPRMLSFTNLGVGLILATCSSSNAANNSMCEKGRNIFKVTIRAFNGEACSIGPVAYWASKNCLGVENYENSQCQKKGKAVLATKDQAALNYYERMKFSDPASLQSPADVSTMAERAKYDGWLSEAESAVWDKIKTNFSQGKTPEGSKVSPPPADLPPALPNASSAPAYAPPPVPGAAQLHEIGITKPSATEREAAAYLTTNLKRDKFTARELSATNTLIREGNRNPSLKDIEKRVKEMRGF